MTDERMIAKAIEEAGRRIATKLMKIENELAEMNARAEANTPVVVQAREEDRDATILEATDFVGGTRVIHSQEGKTDEGEDSTDGWTELQFNERHVVAALKACVRAGCLDCPFSGEENCVDALVEEALKLIRKLLAEKGVEI